MGAMKAHVVAAREAADEARRNYTGVTQPDEAPDAAQGNVEAYSTTSGIPLERLESSSGEWPMSSVLLDEHYRPLPPGRYYKLQSQWLPVDEGNMKERR